MSDQSSPPPKPKPGSLRDRIAAFERPSASTNPPEPKPLVSRPRPSGQVSWKPKPPSPPPPASSPPGPGADASGSSAGERKSLGGAMSASDAKESIVKGGSLKERMAALQAQGGFMGAPPPPTAPKPAVERPKWKPPPQPVAQASPPSSPPRRDSSSQEKDSETSTPDAGSASEIRPIKPLAIPPALLRSSTSEGDHEKPGVERNEEEAEGHGDEPGTKESGEGEAEAEKAEVDPEEEERQRRAALAARMARLGGARIGMAPPVFGAKPGVPKKPDLPKSPPPPQPAKEASPPKDEETEPHDIQTEVPSEQPKDATPASESSESVSAARAPASMPVPAVPRRAAPPRKKPARALPTAPAEEEQAAPAPSEEPKAPEAEETPAAAEVAELGEGVSKLALKEEAAGEDTKAESPDEPATAPQPEQPPAPSQPEAVEQTKDAKDIAEDRPSSPHPEPEAEKSPLVAGAVEHEEPGPVRQPEEDEDEEAHRKRVAEKLAKMGGVNPFAPPPRRTMSHDDGVAPALTSPPVSPPLPPAPERRKSSIDSTISAKETAGVISPRPAAEPVQEVDEQDEEAIGQAGSKGRAERDVDEEEIGRKTSEKKEVDDESSVSDRKQVASEIQEEVYPSASASASAPSDDAAPISHSSQSVSHQSASDGGSSLPRSIRTEANRESRSMTAEEPEVDEVDEVGGEDEREREVESLSGGLRRESITPTPASLPQSSSETTTHEPAEDDSEQQTVLDDTVSPPPSLPSNLRPKLFPAPPTPGGSAVSSPMAGIKPLPPTAPTPASARMISRVLDEGHADMESVAGSPATHPIVLPPRSGAPADEEGSKLFTTEPESEVVEDADDAEILPTKSPLLSISDEEKRRRLQAEQQQKDGVLGRGLGRKAQGDGDESDGEGIPLPIPHRSSLEATRKASMAEQVYGLRDEDGEGTSEAPPVPAAAARPSRGVPPPPEVETDSRHEEMDEEKDYGDDGNSHHALHHVLPAPTISPPRRSLPPPPRARPPPPAVFEPEPQEDPEAEAEAEPSQARPTSEKHGQPSSGMLLPPTSAASVREVLDEEEGDPIDPSFHSPSRRASAVEHERPVIPIPSDMSPTTSEYAVEDTLPSEPTAASISSPEVPAVPPPTRVTSPPMAQVPSETKQDNEDEEQGHRKTIAERMAKLGGIRLGAAPPLPGSFARPPARPRPDLVEEAQPTGEHGDAGPQATDEPAQEATTEEEDERARRERIAAKLAGMGGMRIGMMPLGGLPKQSHILKDEPSQPASSPTKVAPPPTKAVPPPVPQQQDDDSEYESHPSASDDGVKVEAEESEIEEVRYEDVEEAPPPVPPRAGPRRASGTSTMSTATTTAATVGRMASPRPPVPIARPPVPAGFSGSKSIGGKAGQTTGGHSDYVMVEEPSHGFEKVEREDEQAGEEVPPPPPPRPAHRPPPPRAIPPPPPPASQTTSGSSSSDQWELPASTNIEFGATPDLSLSWTDASLSESVTNAESVSSSSWLAPPLGHMQVPPSPSGGQELTLPPDPNPLSVRSPRTPTSVREPPKPLSPESLQLSSDDLMVIWGRVGVQVCEVASSFYERVNKKSLHHHHPPPSSQGPLTVGDGTYHGFVEAVLKEVPNAATFLPPYYGYLVFQQTGSNVQKREGEIMPGDVVEFVDAKLKGFKGIQSYTQIVGAPGTSGSGPAAGPDGAVVGVVGEVEPKKTKIKVYQAGGPTGLGVDSVSYRLDDLKSGTVRIFRMLEA